MMLDPGTAGISAASIFTLGILILKYGPPLASKKVVERPPSDNLPAEKFQLCPDHRYLSASVDELKKDMKESKKDMKESTDKLHARLDEAVKALYRIEGNLNNFRE